VGVGTSPNSGMRKGVVVNLAGPSHAIDEALGEAERMSGYEVNDALISINGSHILSTKADGMIAVGTSDHEITDDDVARIEDVATMGKVPANRQILEVVPHSFRLDGQDNIKDPVGMTGTRLELVANVVSALSPYVASLRKACEQATVEPHDFVVSVLAGARSVLSESQLESGVAVIDMGASTTGVAIFEEGDLQYVGIVPYGSANITNDLAIGLKTDPETAERIKKKHASIDGKSGADVVKIKHGEQTLEFSQSTINEVVEARLEEIFERVDAELKKAGRAGKLPSGVVLVGGGAKLPGVEDFAKTKLGLAAKVGKPAGFGGVAESVESSDFAAAVGLMLLDIDAPAGLKTTSTASSSLVGSKTSSIITSGISAIKNLFSKFRS
jgi:cell division protein FtsA